MIATITFEGTARSGKKKKSVQKDQLHINCVSLDDAKEIFLGWVNGPSAGIKGGRMFHPLGAYGTVKLLEVKELNP